MLCSLVETLHIILHIVLGRAIAPGSVLGRAFAPGSVVGRAIAPGCLLGRAIKPGNVLQVRGRLAAAPLWPLGASPRALALGFVRLVTGDSWDFGSQAQWAALPVSYRQGTPPACAERRGRSYRS